MSRAQTSGDAREPQGPATRVAVLTSGGDAPGMNAAVRGAVRAAIAAGAEVRTVREGYAGLVEGGASIEPCDHDGVSNIMQLGGTVLGTARCAAFREPEGRRQAVKNAVLAGVSRFVIIGGDGSLTGARLLWEEWPDHLAELERNGELTAEQVATHARACFVGMVGSIDNDMVGTDMTIGCDSALHRIVDAMDALTSTARSHQRSFVFEVMGRRCGYLALASAICAGADYVLLPEAPHADWRERVAEAIRAGRRGGKRKSLVVLAEGARDASDAPITAEAVRAAIEELTEVETRITNLGHVQRGGTPSAYDRMMSTLLGVQGTLQLLAMKPGDEPLVMTTRGDEVVAKPLGERLAASRQVGEAMKAGRREDAMAARGVEMVELFDLHHRMAATRELSGNGKRLLVAHVGAPAPGMNPAVRAFGRLAAAAGHQPLASLEGLVGVVEDRVSTLDWLATEDIASAGSTVLGTNRWWPDRGERVVELDAALTRHRVDGVLLVGGFEALRAAAQIETMGLPAAVVPATISNNVPGTDRSLGADTAVNAITEAVDRLKQSAVGSRRRVFVVEVMGRACGYLATVTGIATGSEVVYTHEEGIDLSRLQRDIEALGGSFVEGREVGLVLVADGASDAYDAATVARIYQAQGQGRFDTRLCVLGHLQQGGRPTPRERLAAARLMSRAVDHLANGTGAVVVGLRGDEVALSACRKLLEDADLPLRRPRVGAHRDLARSAGGV